MMKAKQVHPLIKIEQALGHVMQCKEVRMTPIKFVHAQICSFQLMMKCLPQARTNMEQRKETWRIQAAAMSKPGTDQVVVVRRDRLQNMQQGNREFQHVIATPQQLGGVGEFALGNQGSSTFQFPSNPFQQQL